MVPLEGSEASTGTGVVNAGGDTLVSSESESEETIAWAKDNPPAGDGSDTVGDEVVVSPFANSLG